MMVARGRRTAMVSPRTKRERETEPPRLRPVRRLATTGVSETCGVADGSGGIGGIGVQTRPLRCDRSAVAAPRATTDRLASSGPVGVAGRREIRTEPRRDDVPLFTG